MKKELLDLVNEYNSIKDTLSPDQRREVEIILGLYHPSFIEWAQAEFYIPETNKPLVLYTQQQAAINEALRLKSDGSGKFHYSTILWGDIKKSAKTTIGAAMALYTAIYKDYAMVRVIGNDKDQAQSRLFHYIIRCLNLNQELTHRIGAVVRNGVRIDLNNNSYIEAIAVDPEGEAGGGDDLTVFTELWGARSKAHLRLWTETTLSPLKLGYSLRWCETYAGYRGQSPLLENLYDRCYVEAGLEENPLGGHRISDKYPFYTDITGSIFCYWNQTPHLPWQTDEYYNQERAVLDDNEFDRVHRNVFQGSQEKFIRLPALERCLNYGPAPRTYPDTVLYLASDAAYSKANYGMVGVTYDIETDMVTVMTERVWEAPPGDEISLIEAEKAVIDLTNHATVVVWAYDPYQLKRTAQAFESGGIVPTYQFTQQAKRLIADGALLDRIASGGIIIQHNMDLVQHLKNADMKVLDNKKVRIVKREGQTSGPIDLAIALSMAVYVAVSERDKFPPPVRYGAKADEQERRFATVSISNKQQETPNEFTHNRNELPEDFSIASLPKEIA